MISPKFFIISSVLFLLAVQISALPSSSSSPSSLVSYGEQYADFQASSVCQDHYADIGQACGGTVTRGPLSVYVTLSVRSGHCCDAYHQADCMLKKAQADSLCESELYSVVESLKNQVPCTATTCANGSTGHQVALFALVAGLVVTLWRNV